MDDLQDLESGTPRALKLMRELNPLVQCITNFVSMDIMANSLLAAGASPAMVRPSFVFVHQHHRSLCTPEKEVTGEIPKAQSCIIDRPIQQPGPVCRLRLV